MPAHSPLLPTLVNFYESVNTLNMTQQLPEGWKSGNCSTTGRPCYINIYNDKGQWDFPTKTAYQTQIQDIQNTIERQQDEIRQIRSRDLEIRNRQQKEIRELRALLEKQQKEIRELQALLEKQQKEIQELQTLPAQAPPTQAPPASPSLSTKLETKELQQPSSYKPPQPRTCEKCSTTFPSGQALFRHLPDCQPFKCTKCESTFPSNTTLHKHIRGCRRLKKEDTKENSDTNRSEEKQKNQEELLGKDIHKETTQQQQ